MLGLDGPNKDMRVLRWMVGDRLLSFAGKALIVKSFAAVIIFDRKACAHPTRKSGDKQAGSLGK